MSRTAEHIESEPQQFTRSAEGAFFNSYTSRALGGRENATFEIAKESDILAVFGIGGAMDRKNLYLVHQDSKTLKLADIDNSGGGPAKEVAIPAGPWGYLFAIGRGPGTATANFDLPHSVAAMHCIVHYCEGNLRVVNSLPRINSVVVTTSNLEQIEEQNIPDIMKRLGEVSLQTLDQASIVWSKHPLVKSFMSGFEKRHRAA